MFVTESSACEGCDHRVLILAPLVSTAAVVLDETRNAATERAMRSRVGHSLFACIAGQFDAREEADGLRVVEGLQAWKELSGTSVACGMDNMRTWANSTGGKDAAVEEGTSCEPCNVHKE